MKKVQKAAKRKRCSPASPAANASPAALFTPPHPAAAAVRGVPLLAAGVPLPRAKPQAQAQPRPEAQAGGLPWQDAALSSFLDGCQQNLATLFPQCGLLPHLRVGDMARALFRWALGRRWHPALSAADGPLSRPDATNPPPPSASALVRPACRPAGRRTTRAPPRSVLPLCGTR